MYKRALLKKGYPVLLLLMALTVLAACSVRKTDEKKLRDVEFTVLDREDVPEEFRLRIEEAKEEPMKLSYADRGCLYAARGYGVQETSGYSVNVSRCYETGQSIRITTSLLGPGKDEKILKEKTCPYVVLKMEYTDKPVEFD